MPFGDDTFTALKVYPHLFLHPVRIRSLPVSLPSKHIAHSQRSIYAVPIESSPGGWGVGSCGWVGVKRGCDSLMSLTSGLSVGTGCWAEDRVRCVRAELVASGGVVLSGGRPAEWVGLGVLGGVGGGE